MDDGSVSIAATFFMFFSPFGALAHVKARHDRTLIERVATSFGLKREDLGMEFVSRLERPMFPKEETPTTSDLCSRLAGANKISVADVQTRGEGEGAATTFHGIVLQIALKNPLPVALVLEESLTRRGRFGGSALHDTGALVQVRSILIRSRTYGLWLPPDAPTDHPPVDAILNVLHDAERSFHADSWIYSVAVRDHTLNLALSFKRGLFPGLGVFPTRAGIETGIETSRYNLETLLALANALITRLEPATPH